MKRMTCFGIAAAVALMGVGALQAQERDGAIRKAGKAVKQAVREATNAVAGTRLRGTVVDVEPTENRFLVRTDVGKQITLYGSPETVYHLGTTGKTLRALEKGANVDIVYDVHDERYIVNSVALVEAAAPPTRVVTTTTVPVVGGTIRGRIIRIMTDPDQFVLMTEGGRPIAIALDRDQVVDVTFIDKGERHYLASIAAAEPRVRERVEVETEVAIDPTNRVESRATAVEGTIVRVDGSDNLFILRTTAGEEIEFYSEPKARIIVEGQAVPLTEIRPGTAVKVEYEPRGGRKIIRSLIGGKRDR